MGFRFCGPYWTLIVVIFLGQVSSIPIDNGIEGEPEIECAKDHIVISVNTRNPFEGTVYVKGQYQDQKCRSAQQGQRVANIELPFDSCGISRTRSLNPRGIFVGVTIVVSFHPQFITKVDRAYTIQCFYMETDKTVSAELGISDITPPAEAFTQNVPMPVCRYEVLDGGPQGRAIKYALIGQQVYHKWTCDTEQEDTFCMRVHSCTANDGQGTSVEYLNADGCAVDRYILQNLEYLTDLTAGQEAHVFKYADRSQLYFNCQISLTIKEGNACPRPQCPQPTRGRRAAFSLATSNYPIILTDEMGEEEIGTVDVLAHLASLDIGDDENVLAKLTNYVSRFANGSSNGLLVGGVTQVPSKKEADGFCMSFLTLGLVAIPCLIGFFAASVTLFLVCLRRRQPKL